MSEKIGGIMSSRISDGLLYAAHIQRGGSARLTDTGGFPLMSFLRSGWWQCGKCDVWQPEFNPVGKCSHCAGLDIMRREKEAALAPRGIELCRGGLS